jgi:site-specific recombinase XerC
VFIPAAWVPTLREYLAGMEPGPVFRSWFGNRISQRHAQRRFQIWLSRAGIVGNFRAHSLRHGFAMRMYSRTNDLALVQAALGHRSLLSTTIYARPNADRVRAAINF